MYSGDGVYLFSGKAPSNGIVGENVVTTGVPELNKQYPINGTLVAVQVWGATTSGTGSAIIDIEVSALGDHAGGLSVWDTMFTFRLDLTTNVEKESFASGEIAWKYLRVNVKTLNGTGAYVNGALNIK